MILHKVFKHSGRDLWKEKLKSRRAVRQAPYVVGIKKMGCTGGVLQVLLLLCQYQQVGCCKGILIWPGISKMHFGH